MLSQSGDGALRHYRKINDEWTSVGLIQGEAGSRLGRYLVADGSSLAVYASGDRNYDNPVNTIGGSYRIFEESVPGSGNWTQTAKFFAEKSIAPFQRFALKGNTVAISDLFEAQVFRRTGVSVVSTVFAWENDPRDRTWGGSIPFVLIDENRIVSMHSGPPTLFSFIGNTWNATYTFPFDGNLPAITCMGNGEENGEIYFGKPGGVEIYTEAVAGVEPWVKQSRNILEELGRTDTVPYIIVGTGNHIAMLVRHPDETNYDRRVMLFRRGGATGKIIDDDRPFVRLTGDRVRERPGHTVAAVVSAELSELHTEAISVPYNTASGTALAPDDYLSKSGVLVIPAGEMRGYAEFEIQGDMVTESSETFNVNFHPASVGTISTTSVKISIEDAGPMLLLPEGEEMEGQSGATTAGYTGLLSPAWPDAISLGFETKDGTADSGSDYQALRSVWSIPANETQPTLPLTLFGDRKLESDEFFHIVLEDSDAVEIVGGFGNGTVFGNLDVNDAKGISMDSDTLAVLGGTNFVDRWVNIYSRGIDGTWGHFQTLLDSPGHRFRWGLSLHGNTLLVGWDIYERAEAGQPFAFVSSLQAEVLNYPSSDTGRQKSVSGERAVLGDDGIYLGSQVGAVFVFERNEDGEQSWGQSHLLLSPNPVNWDGFGASVLCRGDYILAGSRFTGDADQVAPSTIGHLFRLNDDGSVTHVTGFDLPPEVDARNFGIELAFGGDAVAIGDGSGRLAVFHRSSPVPGGWGLVGIVDVAERFPYDSVPKMRASFEEGRLTVFDSVLRTASGHSDVRIRVFSVTETELLPLTDEGFEVESPGYWAEDVSFGNSMIASLDRSGNEKHLQVRESGNAKFQILDDDNPGIFTGNVVAGEGDGVARCLITLTSPYTEPITISYSTSPGSAEEVSDFEQTSGTVVIPAGALVKEFLISIEDDAVSEESETFTVNVTSDFGTIQDATMVITIVDNDRPFITVDPQMVVEGDSLEQNIEMLIRINPPPAESVDIPYEAVPGSALAGVDFDLDPGTVRFEAGQGEANVPFHLLGDYVREDVEEFQIQFFPPVSMDIEKSWVVGGEISYPPSGIALTSSYGNDGLAAWDEWVAVGNPSSAVNIYKRNESTGVFDHFQILPAPADAVNGSFGYSLDMQSGWLAVGCPYGSVPNNSGGTTASGFVVIYHLENGAWQESGRVAPQTGRTFGSLVDFGDSVLAVQSVHENYVEIFGRDIGGRNQWGRWKRLELGDLSGSNGQSLDISDERLIVAEFESETPALALLFERDFPADGARGLVAAIEPPVVLDAEISEIAVALLPNGDVAVGAPSYQSNGVSHSSIFCIRKIKVVSVIFRLYLRPNPMSGAIPGGRCSPMETNSLLEIQKTILMDMIKEVYSNTGNPPSLVFGHLNGHFVHPLRLRTILEGKSEATGEQSS